MDETRCYRRLYVTYVITFTLLVLFFYNLMANNRKSVIELKRLQEDVNCIAQVLEVDCISRTSKFGDIGRPKFLRNGAALSLDCESTYMNVCMDTLFKRKLGTLLDDVYDIKKEIEAAKCERIEALSELQKNALIIKTTRLNYASEAMGARISKVIAKPVIKSNILKTLLGIDFSSNPPINMLRPDLTPGACFGFLGCTAKVYVHLAYIIKVDGISLIHVASENTPNRCVKTAPKDFEIYGIAPDNLKEEFLGRFEYRNNPKVRIQTYPINNESFYETLVFSFISNHGANATCIYGVEVYGNVK